MVNMGISAHIFTDNPSSAFITCSNEKRVALLLFFLICPLFISLQIVLSLL